MKKKIAFIDRDGVINKKAPIHQHITKVSDFIFNEGIFLVLKKLRDCGFELIIISNQRGVGNGEMTLRDLQDIHEFMIKELKLKGIEFLDSFYCPHQKDECDCRKPKPGLMNQALEKYEIDLKQSVFVGDSSTDELTAKAFGLDFWGIKADHPEDLLLKLLDV